MGCTTMRGILGPNMQNVVSKAENIRCTHMVHNRFIGLTENFDED